MTFKPKYKTGVWLNPVEHAERKAEQKELQMIRKNEFERKKIVHELVHNIIEKIIKEKKEEEEDKLLSEKYFRPKMRFRNGKLIQNTNTCIPENTYTFNNIYNILFS